MVRLVHAPEQRDPMRCSMQRVVKEVEAEDRGGDAQGGSVDALGEAEVNVGQRHDGGDQRRHDVAEAEGQAEKGEVGGPAAGRRSRGGPPCANRLEQAGRQKNDGRRDRLGREAAHPPERPRLFSAEVTDRGDDADAGGHQ